MNIQIMRFVDGRIGPFICDSVAFFKKVFKKRVSSLPDPKTVRNILVLKFWGFGSIVLSTPMLRELKRIFPNSRITLLTFSENEEVCRMSSYIDDVELISVRSTIAWMSSTIRVIWHLRKIKFELGVNLEFFSSFAALLFSSLKIRCRMAFGGFSWTRRVLFDYLVSYENGVHIADKFMNFARVFNRGTSSDVRVEKLRPPKEAVELVKKLLGEILPKGKRNIIVVFNINSSDIATRRKWPLEHFAKTAEWLLKQPDVFIICIGSGSERPYVERLMASLPTSGRAINLAGRITLSGLVALLDYAELYLGNDSGPLHLAVSVGTRSLSIFGPESPLVYGPKDSALHQVFYLGLSCSPCLNIYSNKGARCNNNICVAQISPDAVIGKLKKTLRAIEETGKRDRETFIPTQ